MKRYARPRGQQSLDRGVALQRDRVLRKLVAACADGRLTPAELSARTEAAQRAVGYEELTALLADVPGPRDGAVSGSRRGSRRWLIGFLTICSSARFPALRPRVLAVAVAGEVIVDLVTTPLTAFDTQLTAIAAAGGEVRIIVPPGVQLRVAQARTASRRTFRDRAVGSAAAAPPGPVEPVVSVTPVTLLGAVRVRRSGEGEATRWFRVSRAGTRYG